MNRKEEVHRIAKDLAESRSATPKRNESKPEWCAESRRRDAARTFRNYEKWK